MYLDSVNTYYIEATADEGYYDLATETCESERPEDFDGLMTEAAIAAPSAGPGRGGSRGWMIHKAAKQAVWRPLFGMAFGPRTLQMYRSYAARWHANPNEDFFNDAATVIYNPKNANGKLMRRLFIPAKYRNEELGPKEIDALRGSGAKHGRTASHIMVSANALRMAGNAIAIADCVAGEGNCSTPEIAVMASDTGTTASFIGVQQLYARGFKHIGTANAAGNAGNQAAYLTGQTRAYKLFDAGKKLSYASFGLQALGGAIKVSIEVDRYADDPESASMSAIVDGAVDIGQGTAYSYYNFYLVREARFAARMSGAANIKRATDVLSVSARVIPPRLLWTMRALGIAGGVIAFVPNAMGFHEGYTNGSLPAYTRRHMMISGTMGMASSLLFIGGALLITPPALPIGAILIGVGIVLIAVQTFYDEFDDWKEIYEQMEDDSIYENSRFIVLPAPGG